MDLINERDMSLETGGCSCTQASAKHVFYMRMICHLQKTNKQQTNKHPEPDADGKNEPLVKQEKLVCFYRERER